MYDNRSSSDNRNSKYTSNSGSKTVIAAAIAAAETAIIAVVKVFTMCSSTLESKMKDWHEHAINKFFEQKYCV